jgi:hypothetical protein
MRREMWKAEDVQKVLSSFPQEPRIAAAVDLLPFPPSIENLILDEAAYLRTDGTVVPSTSTPLDSRSTQSDFDLNLFVSNFRLFQEAFPSAGSSASHPDEKAKAKYIIDSLFEVLKVAACCAVTSVNLPKSTDAITQEARYHSTEDYDYPEISVDLLRHDLSQLGERVSRSQVPTYDDLPDRFLHWFSLVSRTRAKPSRCFAVSTSDTHSG